MLAEVLDARLHALWDPAAAEDRLAAASEIIDLARAAGDDARERLGMFWRVVGLIGVGRGGGRGVGPGAVGRARPPAGDEGAVVVGDTRPAPVAPPRRPVPGRR